MDDILPKGRSGLACVGLVVAIRRRVWPTSNMHENRFTIP